MKRDIAPGFKINSLEFIRDLNRLNPSNRLLSEWRCDCGNVIEFPTGRIVTGYKKSCGCVGKEISRKAVTTHGMKGTKEYATWTGIKNRCRNKNNKDFDRYGGRGIDICDEWFSSFESFFGHVGKAPTKSHQIDRVKNDVGYVPGNIRWATSLQQSQNRRNSKRWTVKGIIFEGISEAASHFKVSKNTICRWCYGYIDFKSGKINEPRSDCHADFKY